MDNFNVFLLFPVDGIDDVIYNETDYQIFMNTIIELVDRADCEKGATLYYQGSNKDKCIEQLSIISEMGFYLENPQFVIDELLSYHAEDWEENPKQQEDCFYGIWETESLSLKTEFPDTIKEIGEYILREEHKCLLINIHNSFYTNQPFIRLLKDSQNVVLHQELPTFISISHVKNFKDLEKWFENNREKRLLNRIDERHNEKSPKYISGKSPRLYDFRHIEQYEIVQNLLNTAITDQRCRERESKDLMNYDTHKERFIWFEFEVSNNQYHCYHLAIPRTHEPDTNAEKNIPKRVLDILRVRNA